MKKLSLLLFCSLLISLGAFAQFSSVTNLNNHQIDTGVGTQDRSQSKTFYHDGKHWAVLANSSGTHLWRLDNKTWNHVLQLTTRRGRADCKVVGNVVHVFVFQKNISQLISIEYQASTSSYKLWSSRTSIVNFSFNSEVPTATIDMDGTGRLWLGYVRGTSVQVQWSDAPYANWNSPITIASNVRSDDAAALIALPGKIGVFWSNQVTKRWGFKTHKDGDSPSNWSSDEVPASQSALNVGYGMSDDHMNLKVASDGTLYCAIKTGYNNENYPLIGLLVRRPSGSWDNLYDVSRIGTTPIVVLNEDVGKLRVIYPSKTYGGDILYNESPMSSIAIGPQMTLMKGSAFRDPTSSKQNFSPSGVILTTDANAGIAAGVLVSDDGSSPPPSDQYTLTISTSGSGTVSKSPDQATYTKGSTVSLTATPASGYQFAGWGGDASGTVNPLTLIMDGNKAITATFEVTTTGSQQVTGFVLVDAHTEQDLQAIADGATINLSSLQNTKLNIRANTSPTTVGSVRFELSGAQSKTYTDNDAPYALHGDDGNGNYYYGNWNPPAVGTYTLKATPYSDRKATGTAGVPLTITFTVVEGDGAVSSEKSSKVVPLGLEKLSVHPNPFSDKARVRFTVLEDEDYTISLYDSKGALINVMHQGKAVSGQLHEVDFDGSYLGKGLYIIRLQTKSKNETFRLMLDR
jgi:uncharacterized repeat protein (TIGR02543 family)